MRSEKPGRVRQSYRPYEYQRYEPIPGVRTGDSGGDLLTVAATRHSPDALLHTNSPQYRRRVMKATIALTILLLLHLPGLTIPLSNSCTIVSATDGKTVLFGGNEDQLPNSSFMVVDKRGTLGAVYFATPWKGQPIALHTGINEMGLSFDANSIPPAKLNPHPERDAHSEWAKNVLGEVATVEEMLSLLPSLDFGSVQDVQLHIADRSGSAALIYPGADGELSYVRKPKGPGHLVSTNFNLAQLAAGDWHCLRYRTADGMLSEFGAANDLTVDSVASVLKTTHQVWPITTLYSVVYDLKRLRIYLYYDREFDEPYVLDVKDELAKIKDYNVVSLRDLLSTREKATEQE